MVSKQKHHDDVGARRRRRTRRADDELAARPAPITYRLARLHYCDKEESLLLPDPEKRAAVRIDNGMLAHRMTRRARPTRGDEAPD
jgi:hypothetical protein